LAALITKYIPKERMGEFLRELEGIPGNVSFRDTVEKVAWRIKNP
jgi:hypothetical protein